MFFFNNRVESVHSELKSYLRISVVNFDIIWFKIYLMVNLQLEKIKRELERVRTVFFYVTVLCLFRRLNGYVNYKVIELMDGECERVDYVGNDNGVCGCYLRKIYRLLCVYEFFLFME